MGLLDEAVAEFRLASRRSPSFRLMAMDLLGRALLEARGLRGGHRRVGSADLAHARLLFCRFEGRWSTSAYNLRSALEASGRGVVEALTQFESVFEAEPNYPDVALKIRECVRR